MMLLDISTFAILSVKTKAINFSKNNLSYSFASNDGRIEFSKNSTASISIQNSIVIFVQSPIFSMSWELVSPMLTITYWDIICLKNAPT